MRVRASIADYCDGNNRRRERGGSDEEINHSAVACRYTGGMYHTVQQLQPSCVTDISRSEVEVAREYPGTLQFADDTGYCLQEVDIPLRQAFAEEGRR